MQCFLLRKMDWTEASDDGELKRSRRRGKEEKRAVCSDFRKSSAKKSHDETLGKLMSGP